MRPLAAKGQWHYPVITCHYAFVNISEKDTLIIRLICQAGQGCNNSVYVTVEIPTV